MEDFIFGSSHNSLVKFLGITFNVRDFRAFICSYSLSSHMVVGLVKKGKLVIS